MKSEQAQESKKFAILILDDEDSVRESLRDALFLAFPEVYSVPAADEDTAWKAIDRAQSKGYTIVIALIDQDIHGNNKAGLDFLRLFKDKIPNAYRIAFSGISSRDDVQQMLDEGLIHHFESKSMAGKRREPAEFIRSLEKKVKRYLDGRNPGNVQDPDVDRHFEDLTRQWIDSLPDGGNTEIISLSGQKMKACDLLNNPEIMAQLRRGYLMSKLNNLVQGCDEPFQENNEQCL